AAAFVAAGIVRANDSAPVGAAVGLAVGATALGLAGYADRCRRGGPIDRARLQWLGWGVVVAGIVAAVVWALQALLDWPGAAGEIALGATALVPLSLTLGAFDRYA